MNKKSQALWKTINWTYENRKKITAMWNTLTWNYEEKKMNALWNILN